jgi:hypothetical protein
MGLHQEPVTTSSSLFSLVLRARAFFVVVVFFGVGADESNLTLLVLVALGVFWLIVVMLRMCDMWQLRRAFREHEVG